jgi:putative ABC transport system ATP-binding protein
MYFTKYLRVLRLNKPYVFYALAYGLSTLVIPLGSQFLVNNLALAGIWGNTVSFLTIIAVIIALCHIFRHSMVILNEYLQREIFVAEIKRWRQLQNTENSHYYFEIYTLLKSFAKTYPDLIDMILITFFGLCTLIIFHPAFIVLPIVIGLTIWTIKRNFRPAYESSIAESDVKYAIYDEISLGKGPLQSITYDYLSARNLHFNYVRKHSFKMSVLFAFCIFYVLGIGSYLIHLSQLSVGQLVAAELIVSGIMSSLVKLPDALESLYDFETSFYKIQKALRGPIEAH